MVLNPMKRVLAAQISCTKVTKQESIGKKEKFDHPMKTIIDMGD